MWRIRIAVIILLVAVGLIAGMNVSVHTLSACGCGSINGWVWSDLNALDASIKQYAATHDGLFPSYDEAVELYKKIEPEDYAPKITPDIDVLTGNLKSTGNGKMVAYGVSGDRRSYVLRGIGISDKFVRFVFFGWDLGAHRAGFEYPIFKPGDPDPDK